MNADLGRRCYSRKRLLLALAPLVALPFLVMGLHGALKGPYLQFDEDRRAFFDTAYGRQEALKLASMLEEGRGPHMRSNFAAILMAAELTRALEADDRVSNSSDMARTWLSRQASLEIRKRVSRKDRAAWLCGLGIPGCLLVAGGLLFLARRPEGMSSGRAGGCGAERDGRWD